MCVMLLSHLGESTSQIGILPLKVKLLLGLVIAYIALIDIEQTIWDSTDAHTTDEHTHVI